MSRRSNFVLMLVCLLLAWAIKGILVPEAAAVVSQSRVEGGSSDAHHPLKVVSYNIHIGKDTDGQYDLTHTIRTLQATDADIIGLQEVERNSPRTKFDDQAKQIADALQLEYRFEPGLKMWKFEFGNLLLSKYPIRSVERIELPSSKEQRVGLLAHIDVQGQDVAVLVTHLGLKQEERSEHAQLLADRISTIQQPLILLGDFNTTPQGSELRPLLQRLTLASDKPLVTFPGLQRQIDLVMHTPQLETVKQYTVESTASDHLPVVTEFRLQVR